MALLGNARRGTPIATDHLRPMAKRKPAEQSQLEALIHRKASIDTAIQELEGYQAWHREHTQCERCARAGRASARRRRRSR
jgi:hypothetical protein